ncbi:MAG: hypothetical protein ACKO2L_04305 [Planctomycetaceae bacterium]
MKDAFFAEFEESGEPQRITETPPLATPRATLARRMPQEVVAAMPYQCGTAGMPAGISGGWK